MSAPWAAGAFWGRTLSCLSVSRAGLASVVRRTSSTSMTGRPMLCCAASLKNLQTQTQSTGVGGIYIHSTRSVSFFNELSGERLWEGVTSVSNAGRKRGRGRRVGRRKTTDLNKGQVLGTGKANIVWPGLNAPILKGRVVLEQRQLPPNPERQQELVQLRDKLSRTRYPKLAPLVRGWAGNKWPGQSIGEPDPVGDYKFEGFDTRVLEYKMVCNMTGTLGKKYSFSCFAVTGNGNGVAGFGLGRSQNGRAALRMAKNRAAQNLMYIPRFEDHTVYHDMYTKYHKTKIFVQKKEEGFGLKAHRCLVTISKLIGLKDLYCKVEGSTRNMQTVTKGFFDALVHQETHQQLADRMNLHVVEQRSEHADVPVVVASPSSGIIKEKKLADEEQDIEMDYDRMYMGGKMVLQQPEKRPSYYKLRSHRYKRAQVHKRRNQPEAQLMRLAGQW